MKWQECWLPSRSPVLFDCFEHQRDCIERSHEGCGASFPDTDFLLRIENQDVLYQRRCGNVVDCERMNGCGELHERHTGRRRWHLHTPSFKMTLQRKNARFRLHFKPSLLGLEGFEERAL